MLLISYNYADLIDRYFVYPPNKEQRERIDALDKNEIMKIDDIMREKGQNVLKTCPKEPSQFPRHLRQFKDFCRAEKTNDDILEK